MKQSNAKFWIKYAVNMSFHVCKTRAYLISSMQVQDQAVFKKDSSIIIKAFSWKRLVRTNRSCEDFLSQKEFSESVRSPQKVSPCSCSQVFWRGKKRGAAPKKKLPYHICPQPLHCADCYQWPRQAAQFQPGSGLLPAGSIFRGRSVRKAGHGQLVLCPVLEGVGLFSMQVRIQLDLIFAFFCRHVTSTVFKVPCAPSFEVPGDKIWDRNFLV